MAEEKEFRHIVRVVNVDLDGNKPIAHALIKIKGISFMFANAICHAANVNGNAKTGYLSEDEVKRLNEVIKNPSKYTIPVWMFNRRRDYEDGSDKHVITSDLMFTKDGDLKRLKRIKSYRGLRHAWGLPVRGQRTRSNFRKNKGKVSGVTKRAQRAQATTRK